MTTDQIQILTDAGYDGPYDTMSLIKSCTDHFSIGREGDDFAVHITLDKEEKVFTGADLDTALVNTWVGKFSV